MGDASDPDSADDSFPELEAFVAAQRQRHRRLIAGMVGASALLLALGGGLLWYAQRMERPGWAIVAFLCLGFGGLGLVRAAISAFTDHDTRDRGEWEGIGDLPSAPPPPEEERS